MSTQGGDPATNTMAEWSALGTYVQLICADPEHLVAATQLAKDLLAEVDHSCSRFRPDSDLMRVNAAPGRHTVSPVLVGAVTVALEAAEDTDGLVDPTLGELLISAGYDRTFAALPAAVADPVSLPTPRASWRDIVVVDGTTLDVPEHLGLDLGATGKAFAADLIADQIGLHLGAAALVSVGGDIRTVGDGAPWPVQVASTKRHVDAGEIAADVALPAGAGMATSSTTARTWTRGGTTWHHIMDPRTGALASTQWASVSVVAHSASAANAASTAAIVLGEQAPAWLDNRSVAALLVASDGTQTRTDAWLARQYDQPKD